jgi:predicted RNase H-like HicB family nuclease
MTKHFPIIIEQDENDVYIVECPLFQGCRSYGDTIDDAIKNIKEAIAVCMEEDQDETPTKFIGVRDLELAVA